jgi:hypothetical protein
MNPIAFPLAVAGLVFYFRPSGARYRVLGWTFVFATLVLAALRTKSYFLAPAYPIVFAAGAVAFERARLRGWLAWFRPAYVALLALVGALLAPVVMPILPPATYARHYGAFVQVLSDRFGWDTLTRTVEQVAAGLPPTQRARACVLASNYGEAGALQRLGRPGLVPPVISGHNNYYLWGPGRCTGQVLITVGFAPSDIRKARAHYARIRLAAVQRCRYCVDYEQTLPIYVLIGLRGSSLTRLWPTLKDYE